MKFQTGYSIRDLETLSGIKAHTLRIWEKRYGLLQPDRTETNIRFYTNEDLRRILNVSLLNKHGVKISAIARMNASEMAEKVSAINLAHTGNEDLVDNLVVAMIDLDEVKFGKVFSAGILRMGFEETILHVIFPFFRRIGVMWQTGGINPAQEHFVSNLVRQKLIVAIDGLPQFAPGSGTPVVLLFLPENELHELGLLFYHYALRARKFRTVYLGQAVPMSSLERIQEITRADYLVAVVTNPLSGNESSTFLKFLARLKGPKKILLSGKAILEKEKRLPAPLIAFSSLADLLGHL